jgi:hypothetical protein
MIVMSMNKNHKPLPRTFKSLTHLENFEQTRVRMKILDIVVIVVPFHDLIVFVEV